MKTITAETIGSHQISGGVPVGPWALVQLGWQATKLRFGAAARAHERRCASEAVAGDTMRDTGMDPETASGIHAYQPELPFFMQSGFGKR